MAELRERIRQATHDAMKARDKARVATLRLMSADIQRVEVDERRTLGDEDIVGVLNRMLKQRLESQAQFRDAGRMDLADQETYEISVVREFMPRPLTEPEIAAIIDAAIRESGATSMRDMGKVMALVRDQVTGRADMAQISATVKSRLG